MSQHLLSSNVYRGRIDMLEKLLDEAREDLKRALLAEKRGPEPVPANTFSPEQGRLLRAVVQDSPLYGFGQEFKDPSTKKH